MADILFPECVYLGEFYSKEFNDLPAYLPASLGGFCLTYAEENQVLANRQVENTVLSLFEEMPLNMLKVEVFDFTNKPNFPFINQLKDKGLSSTYLNEQACVNRFNELESIVQHRLHELFSSNETTLNQYNQRSSRPEPYYILIINTTFFPSNSLSSQRLKNFLTTAYDAGIFVIALHNQDLEIDKNNKALQAVLNDLTNVQITKSWLTVDDSILPVSKMVQFDFTFTPADINQTQVINDLLEQFETQSDDGEQDFLNVKIGTYPDGDDAYLTMGENSMNYNAMILGMVGSGKSTLMNNIIMQIGEKYHAGQVRLYLMDYKQGVEFNKFKNHPNVEKIFLRSNDIQAGIGLLEQLKRDIHQRYELFKLKSVDKISVYNRVEPDYPLPFILLMIDEFHKLLKGDYRQIEYVNNLLGEVMRVGRAAGVHLLLCTQSLKGVDLAGDLKDQISLRMTYAVANEGALGFDNFNSQNIKTILGLNKYQVFVQSPAHTFSAYVDRPVEIDASIKRIRLSRPKHLQVQAEIIDSEQTASYSTTSSQTPPIVEPDIISTSKSIQKQVVNTDQSDSEHDTAAIQEVVQSKHDKAVNPYADRFNDMDTEINRALRKLKELEDENEEDSIPEWLIVSEEDDVPDWLNDNL